MLGGVLMLLSALLSGGTVLSETDFSRNGKGTPSGLPDKRIRHLSRPPSEKPGGENGASWQKSNTKTEVVRDSAGDYLKFKLTGAGSQYYTELPKLKKDCPYRLTAVIRNKSDGMASVLLRAGKPYKVWATLPVPASGRWKTWTKTFQFDQDPDPTLVLFLSLRGERGIRRAEHPSGRGGQGKQSSALHGLFRDRRFPDRRWKRLLPGAVFRRTGRRTTRTSSAPRSPRSPENGGTERFLRFHVNGAGAQFQAPLQALEAGRYYRLTFTGDNRTGEPLAFSLRQIASPYTLLAYASANGSSGWKTQTLTFAVDRSIPGPSALFLTIRGTGELDLGSLLLEELSDGEIVTKRPDAKLVNFLRNSRLPLGLQSGWTQESMGSWNNIGKDGRIEPDPAVRGPSGEAALKAASEPGRNIGLYSEPFNVGNPNLRHSASFAVRGSGSFVAEVITEKKSYVPLNRTRFQAGPEWTRIEVPFDPPGRRPGFRDPHSGKRNDLDGCVPGCPGVGKGIPADDAERGLPGLSDSSASEARIQFPDEKAELKYYVSGKLPKEAELRASVTNLYGDRVQLPPVQ